MYNAPAHALYVSGNWTSSLKVRDVTASCDLRPAVQKLVLSSGERSSGPGNLPCCRMRFCCTSCIPPGKVWLPCVRHAMLRLTASLPLVVVHARPYNAASALCPKPITAEYVKVDHNAT